MNKIKITTEKMSSESYSSIYLTFDFLIGFLQCKAKKKKKT